MTSLAQCLGQMSVQRAFEQDTSRIRISLHTDIYQFQNPMAVLNKAAEAGMADPETGDLVVGSVLLALTRVPPSRVRDLGTDSSLPDIADRFNDNTNFEPRVPGFTETMLKYLHRLTSGPGDATVEAVASVQSIEAAPGFTEMDVLGAALEQMRFLTALSDNGILFLHTEQDLHESAHDLHRAMSRHYRFARSHPQFMVATFPDIAPLAGSLAGIIPGRGSWGREAEWLSLPTELELDPNWLEDDDTQGAA